MVHLALLLTKFSESESEIQIGLKLDPSNEDLHINLASALVLQGKLNETKAELEKWKGNLVTYNASFLANLNAFEKAGIIPEERKADVAAIRKLLVKKE